MRRDALLDRPHRIDWETARRRRRAGWLTDDYGGAGAAAPAFAPTDIAGLVAWFKADGTLWQDSVRTTPAVADADPVGSWDDGSGLAHHALQATAGKRPALKLNIKNGLSVVRTDGVDDFLQTAVYTQAQPFTVLFAFSSAFALNKYLFDAQSAADQTILYHQASGKLQPFSGANGTLINYTSAAWATINWVVNGASSLYRINGGTDTASDVGTRGQNGVTLFARQTGASTVAADYGEYLVYSGALSLANRTLLDTYLARWL